MLFSVSMRSARIMGVAQKGIERKGDRYAASDYVL